MEFEWDPDKADSNLRNHGIDFEDAVLIFNGPTVDYEDTRPHNEQRFIAIGPSVGGLLLVVYTMRGGVYRIISARRATNREQRTYREAQSE